MEQAVRVGTVSSVNVPQRTARVIFGDRSNMVSGELIVLRNSPLITAEIKTDNEEWNVTQTYNGTDSSRNAVVKATKASFNTINAALESRQHSADIGVYDWLPYIGQTVLCIMVQSGDGDGFIIGGV